MAYFNAKCIFICLLLTRISANQLGDPAKHSNPEDSQARNARSSNSPAQPPTNSYASGYNSYSTSGRLTHKESYNCVAPQYSASPSKSYNPPVQNNGASALNFNNGPAPVASGTSYQTYNGPPQNSVNPPSYPTNYKPQGPPYKPPTYNKPPSSTTYGGPISYSIPIIPAPAYRPHQNPAPYSPPKPNSPAPYYPAPINQGPQNYNSVPVSPPPFRPAPYQPAPHRPAPYRPVQITPAPYRPVQNNPAPYKPAPVPSSPAPYNSPQTSSLYKSAPAHSSGLYPQKPAPYGATQNSRPYNTPQSPVPSNNPQSPSPAPYVHHTQYAAPYAQSYNNFIPINRFNHFVKPGAGHYDVEFETGNGIRQQESGYMKIVPPPYTNGYGSHDSSYNQNSVANVKTGSVSWTSPEGIPIQFSYISDENGYRVQYTGTETSYANSYGYNQPATNYEAAAPSHYLPSIGQTESQFKYKK